MPAGKSLTTFSDLLNEMERCLESGAISKQLVSLCNEGQEAMLRFEEKAKKEMETDSLKAIKLFSAAHTCNQILAQSAISLAQAKTRNENPVTLEEIAEILEETGTMGKELVTAPLDTLRSPQVETIQRRTLVLQVQAEELGFLKPLNQRIAKIPKEIRKTFVSNAGSQPP